MRVIFLILLISPLLSFSQERDTIFYDGRSFAKGDTVTLGYGLGPGKEFVFVGTSTSDFWGVDPLEARFAKRHIVISKLDVQKGKPYAFGKLANKTFATRFTIRIDIEGAVDNKEL